MWDNDWVNDVALLGRLGLALGLPSLEDSPHVYSPVFEEFLSAFLACHPPKTA